MIEVILSHKAYENDVYPLVKAFYPEEVIKVYAIGEYQACKLQVVQPTMEDDKAELRKHELKQIWMEFLPQCIEISLVINDSPALSDQYILLDKLVISKYKNVAKRFLYEKLSERTNKTLPWGILTGIRPTKLVYELLEQGETDAAIYHHMKSEYLCSVEKIAISIDITRRELQLLSELDYRKGYSVYIGIPFCPSTCLYCSFTSYSAAKYSEYIEKYLEALEKEIRFFANCFPDKKLTTVYLGGGTPTTLSAEQLDRLLGLVKEQFDFNYVKEFCVEAGRPDSITRDKLMVLKRWGVSRISINPQSMQQRTLDIIGRKHTIEQVTEAFQLARDTGHDNINMDIIIGLPGEYPEDVSDTLQQIKKLNPESLTVHTLAIKRAARLNTCKEQYVDMKASEVPQMMEQTVQFANQNGYFPYYLYRQKNMADNLENIGYAREGKEGIYNILIMEEKQTILALGAGAMSKFVFHKENRLERVDNVKSVTDYISRIDEMITRKKAFLDENKVNL